MLRKLKYRDWEELMYRMFGTSSAKANDMRAAGLNALLGDLSAGCKFTSSTYGMIIGIYLAVPQLDYAHVGIDRNLFKTDATDFPIPELDSIGMQTQISTGKQIGKAHV